MQFKGQLLLPGEPGPGLRVNLDVAEHHLAVEADGGGLGAWPLETVAVERLQGDIFALTVAGESLRFVADDTIAFTYSAVPTIERVSRPRKSRSALRSMLDRIWNGPPEMLVSPDPAESALTEAAGRDSDDHQTWPSITEETTPADAYLAGEVVEDPVVGQDDEVEGEVADLNTDPTTEVFSDMGMPFVDIDVPVEVVEDTDTPRAPDVSSSASAWEVPDDPAGCPGIRSDGRRCESPILTSSGYCYPHDPNRALMDKYQSAQEARARLKSDATDRLNRIYARLDKALRQVERGDLDPETAMAMAQLARTMCAILDIDETPPGGHE